MLSRRQFLGALGLPAAAVAPALLRPGAARALLAALPPAPGPAALVARDEDFWAEVARAFTVDRSLMNLNNGGVSPATAFVQDAMKAHLDYSHKAPAHTMWKVLEPQREAVRARLARSFGCSAEEVAITRNASESLQICQFGFDLAPGDEVLTSTQDYPRMINTFKQRERREGIVLRQFDLPVPAEDDDEVVRRFENAITERTKLILMCHMINVTGQILPVRAVVAMARRHDIPVIVDGAHAHYHFPFTHADLDCDYYGSSLHKWLFAPHGTGFLYVRRDKIADLWPLMGADDPQSASITKFEEIGTHPAANALAVAEALTFHEGLGAERKAARLVYLRNRWAERLLGSERIKLHTSLKPGFACGIATVEIDGIEPGDLQRWLWKQHRILTTPIVHDQFQGIRVSPSVYTTPAEIDRFADAMEHAIEHGVG